MTTSIYLAKKHGIAYYLTPEGTTEMHCTDRKTQEFADAARIAERERVADSAIGMLVARLENLQRNGDTWLTVAAVLSMIGDCEMLTSRDNAPTD